MRAWTPLSGSPGYGAVPASKGRIEHRFRAARRAALAASAGVLAGLAALGGLLPLPVTPSLLYGAGVPVVLACAFLGALQARRAAAAIDDGGSAPALAPVARALPGSPARRALTVVLLTLQGLTFPALLGLDVAWDALTRLRARASGQVRDRLHAEAPLEDLAVGLTHAGALVLPGPRGLAVSLVEGGEVVSVTPGRILFPRIESRGVLHLEGEARTVRALRRLIETEALFAPVFCMSREGRRLESRLNALAADAGAARSVEELSLLLEEAQRFERILRQRDLIEDEWVLLAAVKATRLRADLAARVVSDARKSRDTSRLIAPAPTMQPDLARVVDHGGLRVTRELAYVPHWIVPVHTDWGEREVVVHAGTFTIDTHESEALLTRLRSHGAGLFVDLASRAAFEAPAGRPAGLDAEIRRALEQEWGYVGPVKVEESLIETFYVPYVATAQGRVSAVTGTLEPRGPGDIEDPRNRGPAVSVAP